MKEIPFYEHQMTLTELLGKLEWVKRNDESRKEKFCIPSSSLSSLRKYEKPHRLFVFALSALYVKCSGEGDIVNGLLALPVWVCLVFIFIPASLFFFTKQRTNNGCSVAKHSAT